MHMITASQFNQSKANAETFELVSQSKFFTWDYILNISFILRYNIIEIHSSTLMGNFCAGKHEK